MILDELDTLRERAPAREALQVLVQRMTRRQRRELVDLLVAADSPPPDLVPGEEVHPHSPTTPGHDIDTGRWQS